MVGDVPKVLVKKTGRMVSMLGASIDLNSWGC